MCILNIIIIFISFFICFIMFLGRCIEKPLFLLCLLMQRCVFWNNLDALVFCQMVERVRGPEGPTVKIKNTRNPIFQNFKNCKKVQKCKKPRERSRQPHTSRHAERRRGLENRNYCQKWSGRLFYMFFPLSRAVTMSIWSARNWSTRNTPRQTLIGGSHEQLKPFNYAARA